MLFLQRIRIVPGWAQCSLSPGAVCVSGPRHPRLPSPGLRAETTGVPVQSALSRGVGEGV